MGEEVARLQKELANLASAQAEMDKLRKEENTDYTKNRADLEQGIEGVKIALKVLRDYYANDDKAHEEAQGAGQGIIGSAYSMKLILPLCEPLQSSFIP